MTNISAAHASHADDGAGLVSFATKVILEGVYESGGIVSIDHILENIGWEQTPEVNLLLRLIQDLRANPCIGMTDDDNLEFFWCEDSADEVLEAMAPEYVRWGSPAEIVKRILARYRRNTSDQL